MNPECLRVRRRWLVFALLAASVVQVRAEAASSSDRFVISRNGERMRLTRSESEFAVVYRNLEGVKESARRLAAKGLGVVVDRPGEAQSKIRILKAADASAERRRLILKDPAVAQVFRVYRFDGLAEPVVSTGTINVKLRSGLSAAQVGQLWKDYRLEVVSAVAGLKRVYRVKPIVDERDEVLRAASLAGDVRTEWAQPDFRIPTQTRQIAQDEFFGDQWHLNNTGQLGGTPGADIDATEAWTIATGEGVLVGMYDDSCDVTHEDLRDNYLGIGQDPTVAPGSPGADDPRPKDSTDAVDPERGNRHGTAVMGLAVASANSVGVRGVAFDATFTASRGMSAGGVSSSGSEVASVYAFAMEQGVDVHINSWGYIPGFPIPAIVEDALETAFLEGRDLDGPEGDGSTNRPPRGMVVVFAAGNDEKEIGPGGNELSVLPTVIGVGATDDSDSLVWFSNFGRQTDVLAPGLFTATTDNDDAAGYPDWGFNVRGTFTDPVGNTFADLDENGLYSGFFSGTSASCPIVAGVAALVLSVNELLTATDVRLILEHTTDQINPDEAQYDEITRRSLKYAYGRVNARSAVEAAQDSLTNGGRTWPERPAAVTVVPGEVRWVQNGDPLEFLEDDGTGEIQNDFARGTDEFLVLESDSPFEGLTIEDGKCYDVGQDNCADTTLTPLPPDVSIAAVGCELACGQEVTTCEAGARHCVSFPASGGTKYFAIYARSSSSGRYSFGVRVDSVGNVLDSGQLPPGATAIGGGGSGTTAEPPNVTISVSPLEGTSPLTVSFTGNAISALEIDDNLSKWDFGDGSPPVFQRTTEHIYEVADGETETFIASLTMYDVDGNQGSAQVAITVVGQASAGAGAVGSGNIRINIGVPGTTGSDVDSGVSPFQVELSLQTTAPIPTDSVLQSVFWDLGDGTTATSLTVTHTYVNTTLQELRLPITATITSQTSAGVTTTTMASRRITVLPGTAAPENPDVVLEGTTPLGGGGSASQVCGTMGMVPLLFGLLSMMCLRRRRG